jgi:Spy/CpxP family protein refolding chaperone
MYRTPFTFAVILGIAIFSSQALAQDEPNEPPAVNDDRARPPASQEMRVNMLRRLGLTAEQIGKLRKINQERQPKMEMARIRLAEANRMLDEAIYADSFDRNLFDARLREVQNAQNEILKLRFESELAVRQILTAEQLAKFRELRDRFEVLVLSPPPIRGVPGPRRERINRPIGPPKRFPPPVW